MKKVLSLLAFAVILVGMSACGGASGSPDAAVKSYLDAMKKADVTGMVAVSCNADGEPIQLTPEDEKDMDEAKAFLGMFSGMEFTVGDTELSDDGNKAEVSVTIKLLGHEQTQEITCLKGSDGKWRVNAGIF